MLLTIAILANLIILVAIRHIDKKKIQNLIREHEFELTQFYFASYIKGRREGFKEGRESAKIMQIRMFN